MGAVASWGQWDVFKADLLKSSRAVRSYLYHLENVYSRENDYFHLRGQDNVLKFQAVGHVGIRIHEQDSLFESLARLSAAWLTGCPVTLSVPANWGNATADFLFSHHCKKLLQNVVVKRENEASFINSFQNFERIRYACADRVSREVYQAAAKSGLTILRSAVLHNGRYELPLYMLQQSLSNNYHRYGNLGERAEMYNPKR